MHKNANSKCTILAKHRLEEYTPLWRCEYERAKGHFREGEAFNETVDIIVAELAKDKDIAELYSKWNELNREKLSLYSEKKTPDIPLENNKEFRSIKNVIVKAAVEFNNTQYQVFVLEYPHKCFSFG